MTTKSEANNLISSCSWNCCTDGKLPGFSCDGYEYMWTANYSEGEETRYMPVSDASCVDLTECDSIIPVVYMKNGVHEFIPLHDCQTASEAKTLVEALRLIRVSIGMYQIRWNPMWKQYQTSHIEIGVCESFPELADAIDYCLKG